ncbi:MAG: glycosyltransferase, partial [Candidatus Omnitrophica bacterium]|nr:glycosyltransferase [Candidatus Omnitrophota bacterium]
GDAGIAGPQIRDQDGKIRYECARRFHTPLGQFFGYTGLEKRFPRNALCGRYLMTAWDHNDTREVEAITGACMLVRRRLLQDIGPLFDESFFMYAEDADTCYRARKAGWKVYFVATARIIHYWNKSAGQAPLKMQVEMVKAVELFFKKNCGWGAVVTHRVLLVAAALGMLVLLPPAALMSSAEKRKKWDNILARAKRIVAWGLNLAR